MKQTNAIPAGVKGSNADGLRVISPVRYGPSRVYGIANEHGLSMSIPTPLFGRAVEYALLCDEVEEQKAVRVRIRQDTFPKQSVATSIFDHLMPSGCMILGRGSANRAAIRLSRSESRSICLP